MRVFLAGATGVIGCALVPRLLAAGHEVTGMTRSPERAEQLRAAGAAAVVADAFDADAVREAVLAAQPEVVIDELTDLPASFPTSRGAARDAYAANDRLRIEGMANVLAAARAAGARRYVAQSIAFVAAPGEGAADEGAPLALDAPEPMRSAVHAVQTLEQRTLGAEDIEPVVLRYGQFYGPGTYFAPGGSLAEMVRRRRFPLVGDAGAAGNFVHIEDAAEATLAAIGAGAPTGIFHVCADETPPAREWLPAYARALGAPPPRHVPAWLARLVAGPAAVWFATRIRAVSVARARAELGFSSRPFSTPAET
jgi:nucleoside-diphosphate-sugar epimerase